MTRVMESAAVRDWGVLDCHAPTADETCPRCGAPTEYLFRAGELFAGSEVCRSCGWLAEFDDEGGNW